MYQPKGCLDIAMAIDPLAQFLNQLVRSRQVWNFSGQVSSQLGFWTRGFLSVA